MKIFLLFGKMIGFFGICTFDRLEDIFRAWVHRLSAIDDCGDTHALNRACTPSPATAITP